MNAVRSRSQLSQAEARWLAIEAQGLARPRPQGPIARRHLRAAIEAVGTIQLDAINVLERTQFLVPFSRLGPYDVARLHQLTGPYGELLEYWGHAASLLPMAREPLFRWRMAQDGPLGDSPVWSARRRAWRKAHAAYIASVLEEVRARGPLAASQLRDPRRRDGEWWGRRSVGRQALEFLFARGELSGWRTPNFERVYDLPERVIPESVRSRRTPSIDESHRELLLLAARSLGVATLRELASYYMLKPAQAKPRVAELVEAGRLVELGVEGWREAGYALPGARPTPPRREHATLLSPFDSLVWERARTLRLFGFDYRIEVYTPAPQRKYGYYVLPLLLRDRLVARLDLKADRRRGALEVRGAYLEPGADPGVVAPAAATELDALREWLRLDRITLAGRGDLASPLRRALR
jgi:hypothetical protein